jgi:hypothetical protein
VSRRKVEKEHPESVTCTHAWLHERTGIPITYGRKECSASVLDVNAGTSFPSVNLFWLAAVAHNPPATL